MRLALITLTTLLAAAAAPANASVIILGTHADYEPQPGTSLEDVRMAVDLSVEDGLATMTFTNASVSGETAVLEEISLDGYENDTDTPLLWNPTVLTSTDDVKYTVSKHPNGVPGYQTETADLLIELQAKSSPVKYGIAPGEALQVSFDTSLADGASIYDYFNAFGNGEDTRHYTIGFHAISAQVVNGESLSGVALPEPATVAFLAIGSLTVLGRKSRK